MKPSPIQLLQLMFKSVHVEIDPAHALPEPTNPISTAFVFDGIGITTEVGLAEVDLTHERGAMYLVSLRVVVNNQPAAGESESKFSPYLIDVEVAGVVLLPKGAEKLGPADDLVTVNGAALLWSAIREQLLTLTSRMPAGPVMLPTVHFHDLKQSPAPVTAAAIEPPAASKKKAAKAPSAARS